VNTCALERKIDSYIVKTAGLRKEADTVLPAAKSLGGALGQTAMYATPILGSALSIGDGIKSLANGHIWSGLGNLGLGIGSGIADLLSFGIGGTAIRSALAGTKGALAATRVGKNAIAAKNALNATRFGRAVYGAGRFGLQAATGLPVGKTVLTRAGMRAAYNDANFNNLEAYMGRSDWDRLSPAERGNYLRGQLYDYRQQQQFNPDAKAAPGSYAEKRQYMEAMPRYGWNYQTGSYQRNM